VDPNIFSEQTGLRPESHRDEEGVSYLRRLKGGTAATAEVRSEARAGAGKATGGWKEKRRSPRLRCSGSVEYRAEGSEIRMWGTLIDISLHGCYVEMSNTNAIDTPVQILLKSCGFRIETGGVVRASYPALGMGICFTEMEPDQRSQLRQLIEMLAGNNAVSDGLQARENPVNSRVAVADPKALVDEVTEFFRKNQLLSRDEFHQMAKRVRRP
jgi:hypothetical protein